MKNHDDQRLLAIKQSFDAQRRQRALMAKRAKRARAAQAMSRIANARRAS